MDVEPPFRVVQAPRPAAGQRRVVPHRRLRGQVEVVPVTRGARSARPPLGRVRHGLGCATRRRQRRRGGGHDASRAAERQAHPLTSSLGSSCNPPFSVADEMQHSGAGAGSPAARTHSSTTRRRSGPDGNPAEPAQSTDGLPRRCFPPPPTRRPRPRPTRGPALHRLRNAPTLSWTSPESMAASNASLEVLRCQNPECRLALEISRVPVESMGACHERHGALGAAGAQGSRPSGLRAQTSTSSSSSPSPPHPSSRVSHSPLSSQRCSRACCT